MKKSEAIEIIQQAIGLCNGAYKEHRIAAAKRILEALLDAGMKPAMVIKESENLKEYLFEFEEE